MNIRALIVFCLMGFAHGCGGGAATPPPREPTLGNTEPPPPPIQLFSSREIFAAAAPRSVDVSWSLPPGGTATIPLLFDAPGELRVELDRRLAGLVGVYINEQESNNRGSTPMSTRFDHTIRDEMTHRNGASVPWFLHVVSEAGGTLSGTTQLNFEPVPVVEQQGDEDSRREEVELPPPPRDERPTGDEGQRGTGGSGEREVNPEPEVVHVDPPAECSERFDLIRERYNRGGETAALLPEALALAESCSGSAQPADLPPFIDILVAWYENNRLVPLLDLATAGECDAAEDGLAELEEVPELASRARNAIEECRLDDMPIALADLRLSDGVERQYSLPLGEQQTFRVRVLERGDFDVRVDVGYSVEADGLTESDLVWVVQEDGEEVQMMRFRQLNVVPGTVFDLTVTNRAGDPVYRINVYLYPS